MRQNKEIARLTEYAKTVNFPASNSSFEHYKNALRNLVADNFGYTARHDFDYDETTGKFFWVEEYGCGFWAAGGGRVVLKKTFEVDPKASLADEFQRVVEEIAEIKERQSLLLRTVRNAGGDV